MRPSTSTTLSSNVRLSNRWLDSNCCASHIVDWVSPRVSVGCNVEIANEAGRQPHPAQELSWPWVCTEPAAVKCKVRMHTEPVRIFFSFNSVSMPMHNIFFTRIQLVPRFIIPRSRSKQTDVKFMVTITTSVSMTSQVTRLPNQNKSFAGPSSAF